MTIITTTMMTMFLTYGDGNARIIIMLKIDIVNHRDDHDVDDNKVEYDGEHVPDAYDDDSL